jgi:hypothetical protein
MRAGASFVTAIAMSKTSFVTAIAMSKASFVTAIATCNTVYYGQTIRPRGSAIVQFLVTPSCVSATFATFVPSYVITSRRDDVTSEPPSAVTDTFIDRMTLPAVGYGYPVVTIGMITPVVVSPIIRSDVNAPDALVPVVLSRPDETPLTVRCVLPVARPPIVRELELVTVVRAVLMSSPAPLGPPLPPGPKP